MFTKLNTLGVPDAWIRKSGRVSAIFAARKTLSQRQLARQSGVANATISQIEAGKLNPTVSMLKKVLDGIPISLGEFFGEPDSNFASACSFAPTS